MARGSRGRLETQLTEEEAAPGAVPGEGQQDHGVAEKNPLSLGGGHDKGAKESQARHGITGMGLHINLSHFLSVIWLFQILHPLPDPCLPHQVWFAYCLVYAVSLGVFMHSWL